MLADEEEKEQSKKKKKNNTMKLYNKLMVDRENNKTQNDKEKSLKHRWINLNSAFSQAAFGKNFVPTKINLGGIYYTAICSYNFNVQVQKQNNYKEGMKFQGADKIIKRLAFF
mmetsp:Transcript_18190/g.17311  ORF Transcript_18190/g.17311 Transcript_18190/m.17311 type:complete len:113 (+) Transcript_18190:520-858(+)